VTLPGKTAILRACAGSIVSTHPILLAAYELTTLHTARLTTDTAEITCNRALLMRTIDRSVAEAHPHSPAAAYLHTESLGTVIDRLARYTAEAHAALRNHAGEPHRHHLWQRLAELACGYADLAIDIDSGRRTLPTYTHLPTSPHRREQPDAVRP
jgi:hypothetical protein